MSRSIHETRTDFRHELRFEYADGEARRRHLRRFGRRLLKKRRLKAFVRTARKSPRWTELPHAAPEVIPIEIVDQAAGICYPATRADLVAVMDRLPAGVLSGLSGIRLCPGKEYLDEKSTVADFAECVRDPWLRRLGDEILPGVFAGRVLGTYWHGNSRIELYAYVHDPSARLPITWEIFLRLQILATFVHEVAHHQDRMQRLAGSRWTGDDDETVEGYANSFESEWVRRHVAPYLEEAYPDAVDKLLAWIRDHGGASLTLSMLASDCWWRADGVVAISSFGSARDAFEALVRETSEGGDAGAARVSFARQLDQAGHDGEAMRVAEKVLREQPANVGALALLAKLLVDVGELRRAEATALLAVKHDFACVAAWQTLARVREALQDWAGLLEAASRLLSLTDAQVTNNVRPLRQRARANLELERFDDAAADLQRLANMPCSCRWADAMRPIMLLGTGRYEEAIAMGRNRDPNASLLARTVLDAVAWAATRKLDPLAATAPLPSDTLDALRRLSFTAWADRLAAESSR